MKSTFSSLLIAVAFMVLPSCLLASDAVFTALLKDHVRNGAVDYARMRNDVRLSRVLDTYAKVNPASLHGPALIAFYINLYNATTLKLVCDAYPIQSIKELGNETVVGASTATTVWDRATVRTKSGVVTLNHVEHKILRPMNDPRIHFALVCAAVSCPPLRSEAYTAEQLSEQLNDQGRTFLATPVWNSVDVKRRSAKLSQIFNWFRTDFASSEVEVLRYLARFLPLQQQQDVQTNASSYTVSYLDYDWKLNASR